jgi:hypothetical protein
VEGGAMIERLVQAAIIAVGTINTALIVWLS